MGADAGKLLGLVVGSQKSSHLIVPFSLLRVKDLEFGSLRRMKNIETVRKLGITLTGIGFLNLIDIWDWKIFCCVGGLSCAF